MNTAGIFVASGRTEEVERRVLYRPQDDRYYSGLLWLIDGGTLQVSGCWMDYCAQFEHQRRTPATVRP